MNYEQYLDKIYILNPLYVLRNDITRIVLLTVDLKNFESIKVNNIITFIHPVYAMLLAFFKGDKPLHNNIEEVASYFDISYTQAGAIVCKFIDNMSEVAVEYDNQFFYFPKRVLIEKPEKAVLRNYSPEDFIINKPTDFVTHRLNIPVEAAILINNKCVTNCIYCYADKRKIYDCTIPLTRIKEIIQEAKQLGITSFDIQGGELFLYEHWDQLLRALFEANYSVYISTKCPLNQEDIDKLLDLGVTEIQISLDSIYADDLKKNLKVGEKYHSEILNTVKMLDEAGLSVRLKAVITGKIFDVKKIEDYIDYFRLYHNIVQIEFTAPAHSLYKTQQEFFEYKLNRDQLLAMKELVKGKSRSGIYPYLLGVDIPEEDNSRPKTFDEKKQAFYQRSKCTGNLSSFIILPNGDVSVCEETYFNKNLILGNILNHSILDFWNSEQAKNLFYIPQAKFPMESPCSKCAEFAECRYDTGICWTDAMAAYGEENWLFPTADCPYAPPPKNITNVW